MTTERDTLARLRDIATAPEARGLLDDAALFDGLVITHDTIAEGVHFLPFDPPASVGWKLVAVNLSDLAAKGAAPAAALLSLTIGESDWDHAFLGGIDAACESYGISLIGGDTVALPPDAPRVLGMTAIGRAGTHTPSRSGAQAGDRLWLAGTVGDAAAGLFQLRADRKAQGALVDIYRRPIPLLAAGRVMAARANAMMDVSDGLLLDTLRMAQASALAARIDIDALPLSAAFLAEHGDSRQSRLFAATGGDDYALLAAFPRDFDPRRLDFTGAADLTCIGGFEAGAPRITLTGEDGEIPLPPTLGFEHSA